MTLSETVFFLAGCFFGIGVVLLLEYLADSGESVCGRAVTLVHEDDEDSQKSCEEVQRLLTDLALQTGSAYMVLRNTNGTWTVQEIRE